MFYILNYYTPLYADDYSYSVSFLTGKRIESIYQIIDSQIRHYEVINGRVVTHTLAQLFLFLDDKTFNIVNTLAFLFLLYLIYFHAFGSFRDFSLISFSMIAMLLFLASPAFGQSFLWITGASNYMYGIFIILLFLIPYRIQIQNTSLSNKPLSQIIFAVVYPLFGIIAGWTNENTSVAMITIIIGYIICFHLKRIKIHLWNFTGCIGGVIGCFFMLSAPGNSIRLESSGGFGSIIDWGKRIVFITCNMIINLQLLLLLFVIIIAVYVYQHQDYFKIKTWANSKTLINECGLALVYCLGFLASVYSMIVSPSFPERAWSGSIILCLIALGNFSLLVDFSPIKCRLGKFIALFFVFIVCASTYTNAYFELKNIHTAYCERISIIETAEQEGKREIYIPNIIGWSGYSCYGPEGDLDSDSSNWPNTAIANYYGVDSINLKD